MSSRTVRASAASSLARSSGVSSSRSSSEARTASRRLSSSRRAAIPYGGDGDFVEAARGLLAVAGDEGDGGVFVQQADDGFGLLGADAQFSGYERCVVGHTDSLAVGLAVADASSEGVRRGPVGETARAATVCFFAEKENVPALGGCGLDLGAGRDHSTAIFLSKEFS